MFPVSKKVCFVVVVFAAFEQKKGLFCFFKYPDFFAFKPIFVFLNWLKKSSLFLSHVSSQGFVFLHSVFRNSQD